MRRGAGPKSHRLRTAFARRTLERALLDIYTLMGPGRTEERCNDASDVLAGYCHHNAHKLQPVAQSIATYGLRPDMNELVIRCAGL